MSSLITNPAIRSLIRGILVWAPLWISTTAIFGSLGLVYVLLFKQDTYLASQALLVRDEATGAVMRLGRFQSQAEMKAAQETILEMAKSHQVVRDALISVGPPKGFSSWFNWGRISFERLGRGNCEKRDLGPCTQRDRIWSHGSDLYGCESQFAR